MLYKFLETIQSGKVQSLFEIAQSMGISPDMALHMAQELSRKGYLQEIGADCAIPQKTCPECPISNSCNVAVKHWFLTEKARQQLLKK